MSWLDVTGRMVQWVIELSQFDIMYKPRTAIKAQELVDFIAEFTQLDPNLEVEYLTIHIDDLLHLG